MQNREMAILIIGFDGYSDLWDDFFNLFSNYWKDCPYRIYLANNTERRHYKNVTVINVGKEAEWSHKVSKSIELIKEKYICLLLEDFFIGKKVNNLIVDEVITLMNKFSIKYYKLNTFSRINKKNYKNIKYLFKLKENMEYAISLLPAIWDKKFLKEKVGKGNYNAWKFECDRIAEMKKDRKDFLDGCVYDNRNILNIEHGVVQGKYLPETVKYFRKRGYELNRDVRNVMSIKEELYYKIKRYMGLNLPKNLKFLIKVILIKVFKVKFISEIYK